MKKSVSVDGKRDPAKAKEVDDTAARQFRDPKAIDKDVKKSEKDQKKLEKQKEKLQKKIDKIMTQREKEMEKQKLDKEIVDYDRDVLSAFVTCHTAFDKELLEEAYRLGKYKVTRPFQSKKLRFFGRHALQVEEAVEPTNINWENMDIS